MSIFTVEIGELCDEHCLGADLRFAVLERISGMWRRPVPALSSVACVVYKQSQNSSL